jgi:hypothetical protein
MSKISISEVARLAGISRTNLYKTYINTGKISVSRENDKVYIDASELIRVFPDCKLNSVNNAHGVSDKDNNKTQGDSEVVELLKIQLAEAKEREKWLIGQIDDLRQQQSSLLENKIKENDDSITKKRKKFLGIF